MRPSFDLDKYEIISCTYSRNVVGGEYEGTVKFEPMIQRAEDDSSKFRVEIRTLVSGLADIELVVAGYFTSTGLLDDELLEESILFSSMYLLLPFIRSYIHTISCQDGRPAVTIPVVNVAQLLRAPTAESSTD